MLEQVQDIFGGGALSPVIIIGGLVALFIAYKAAKFAMKLVSLAVGATLLFSVAPWSGADLDGRVADCARAVVEAELSGWQATTTKRVTVDELSPDAACASGEVGLSQGSGVVRLRSFFDIPFQTWDVTPAGADARIDLPDALPGQGG